MKPLIILIAVLATTTYAKESPSVQRSSRVVSAPATATHAKVKRLKSFCGFMFGSANTHPDQLDMVDKPLPKPFMHFTKATLIYGKLTKKLYSIVLAGYYPSSTAFSTVKNDASTLMDMLKDKYGFKFSHREAQENETVVFCYSSDLSADTIIGIAIYEIGPLFILNVVARDRILQDEGNGGSLLKRHEVYDVL